MRLTIHRPARTSAVAAVLLLFAAVTAASTAQPVPAGMVVIPAGVYRPLFREASDAKETAVPSFLLDALPVTVADYLEFVRANPHWQRSQVKRIFADEAYLKNWAADLDPGTSVRRDGPVTHVSWFAARAYAQWKGKRLPTLAEWELAAAAGADRPDGEKDPAFRQQVLRWYTSSNSEPAAVGKGPANFYEVYDLHGLVWEWVLDFNTALLTGDSRTDASGLERGLFCGAGSQSARDSLDYPAFMRTGFRSSLEASYCVHNLGFRCAKDL